MQALKCPSPVLYANFEGKTTSVPLKVPNLTAIITAPNMASYVHELAVLADYYYYYYYYIIILYFCMET
jgi:hypothetical protein